MGTRWLAAGGRPGDARRRRVRDGDLACDQDRSEHVEGSADHPLPLQRRLQLRDRGDSGRKRNLGGIRARRQDRALSPAVAMQMSRRTFLTSTGLAGPAVVGALARARTATAQAGTATATRLIDTSTLKIGYEDHGDQRGFPILLLHGFPDDVHALDEVAPALVKSGY